MLPSRICVSVETGLAAATFEDVARANAREAA
jgi:hypothetical protein